MEQHFAQLVEQECLGICDRRPVRKGDLGNGRLTVAVGREAQLDFGTIEERLAHQRLTPGRSHRVKQAADEPVGLAGPRFTVNQRGDSCSECLALGPPVTLRVVVRLVPLAYAGLRVSRACQHIAHQHPPGSEPAEAQEISFGQFLAAIENKERERALVDINRI
jgi:hypothetical protein